MCWLQYSHTEIDNLDIAVAVQKDVLRLQVSMADIETVTVGQSSEDLAKEANGFVLWELAVRRDMVEQLATIDVFEDNIPGSMSAIAGIRTLSAENLQLSTVFPHIKQADDIGMFDQLHDDDLALNAKRYETLLALVSSREQLLHMRQACRP